MHRLNLWRTKTVQTFLKGFFKVLNKSKGKPIKLLINQEREFYNNLMQIGYFYKKNLLFKKARKPENSERVLKFCAFYISLLFIGHIINVVINKWLVLFGEWNLKSFLSWTYDK